MASKPCSLCFKLNKELILVSVVCEHNLTVLQKLAKVAPFQDWINCYSICQNCKNLLDISYRFVDMCSKYLQNKRNFLHKEQEKRLTFLKLNNSQTDDNVNTDKVDLHGDLDDTMNDLLGKGNIEAEYVEINDIIDGEQLATEFITVDVVGSELDQLVYCPDKINNADGKKDFKCVICDKTFISLINLEMHYRFVEHRRSKDDTDNSSVTCKSSRPLKELSCEVCDKTFSYEKMFIQHCETQHSMEKSQIRPYQCDLCPSRLMSSNSFRRHLLYHEGIKRFTCTFCGKGFVVDKDLGEHEKIHLNEKNYRCEKCDKSFNTYSNLRTHNFNVHSDPSEWKHLCNFCPKRFPMKSTLNEHLKRHQGIKDHQCVSCGLWFTTKHCLERHMYSHTKDRPYKCKWCSNRSFRDRKGLRVHMLKQHAMTMK